MTTMPVVWCTDPNSVNNKPTAFALHGIQLQGNVTEKQVLALRELVNAAAEGRLILPSDGTFMLLDSGISIESSIVEDNSISASLLSSLPTTISNKCLPSISSKVSNKGNIDKSLNEEKNVNNGQSLPKNTYILMPVATTEKSTLSTSIACTPTSEFDEQINFELEPKYSTFTPSPSMGEEEDILYEFLCCAKCMNNPSTSHCSSMIGTVVQQRKAQSQQLLHRLLKSCERYSISHRRELSYSDNIPRSSNKSKANEQHQMFDPKYNIANKYTRRYQRKHCNMSAATIARNRHHNYRHKLPMQSGKIFHNRNYACINGSGGNSVAYTRSARSGSGDGSFSNVDLKKSTNTTTLTTNSNSSCNINTIRSGNGNNIDVCWGKTTKTLNKFPLVVNQQSSAIHLPLYATVNKANGKTKMTIDLNVSEQSISSKVVTVNAIVHEFPLYKPPVQNSLPSAGEHIVRQRKVAAVHGGLQETVQIELNSLDQNAKNPYNKYTNCDIVTKSLPEIKDLISFEDDDNNENSCNNNDNSIQNKKIHKSDNCLKTSACDTNSQIVDLLFQPNINLPAISNVAVEDSSVNKSPSPSRSNASSRKTSFDSTCTISSMDSGFIEMQNKLENTLQTSSYPTLSNIFNNISLTYPLDQQRQGGEKIARLNYKECLTQSRNRRKSYEEFKAMFVNSQVESESSSPSTSYTTDNNNGNESKTSIRRYPNQDSRNHECGCQQLTVVSSHHQHHQENQTEIQTTGLATTSTLNGLESISEQPISPTMILDAKQKLVKLNSPKDLDGVHESGGNTVHCESNVCSMPFVENITDSNKCDISHTTTDILRKNSDFLSKILDHQLISKENEKAHMRRKSYEEFKRLVSECEKNTVSNQIVTACDNTEPQHFKRQNSKNRKSYSQFLLTRRNSNSKDHNNERQRKKNSTFETKNDTRKKKLELQPVSGQAPETHSNSNYRRNFKIYDKLIYGTIYDIIQRKNDIYNLTCQRYDKYMTYGTIYEILHRKSSQSLSLSSSQSYNGFNSEKLFQRKSLSAILEKDIFSSKDKNTKSDSEKTQKSNIIYDIIQKQRIEQSSIELVKLNISRTENIDDDHSEICLSTSAINDTTKLFSSVLNTDTKTVNKETLPSCSTTNVTYKYGTIYDILQGEKLDSSNEKEQEPQQQKLLQQNPSKSLVNNRFIVRKIDETLVANDSKIKDIHKPALEKGQEDKGEDVKNSPKISKPNKMRRLSNMLSYMGGDTKSCDKSSTSIENKNVEQNQSIDIMLQASLLPLDSEELYARIIARKRENECDNVAGKSGSLSGHIHKSNSLDTISTAVLISPPASPSPPRPRRSLKQHKCLLSDQQKVKQLPLVKKMSLDNYLTGEDRSITATDKELKLRRWSNQIPLKCNCDLITLSSNNKTASFSTTPNSCNSLEASIKMIATCNCFESLTLDTSSSSKRNMYNNNYSKNNEAPKTQLSPINTSTPVSSFCTQLMRNTCTVHSDTVCHCSDKQNKTNTPTTTLITTSMASSNANSKISAKKGKSRRLSEFTRGEFLNEKP